MGTRSSVASRTGRGTDSSVGGRKAAKPRARRPRVQPHATARAAGEAVGSSVTKVTKLVGAGAAVAALGATKGAKALGRGASTVGGRIATVAAGTGLAVSAFAAGLWSKL